MAVSTANQTRADVDFLVMVNPFTTETTGSQTAAIATATQTPAAIYRMVKEGGFGFRRQQILEAFHAVGGSGSTPSDLKALIKLCLEIEAESNKSGAKALKLWFDPFSGRLELECRNGLKDSLTIYSRAALSA